MWKSGQPRYFEVGLSALDCITRALEVAGITPTSILDLPCGHGRVCRMLRMAFPDARLTVSDLDADGVDFCAEQFRGEPLYSSGDIRDLKTGKTFDLIWCGSLFTHLDRTQWKPFLDFFADHLRPQGVLVFTTHGRRSVQLMAGGIYAYGLRPDERRELLQGYQTSGFGYVLPASQRFGLSLSSTAVVCQEIERCHELGLIGLHEGGWADHHDAVACVRVIVPYVSGESWTASDVVRTDNRERTPPQVDRPMGNIDEPLRDVVASGHVRLSGWAADKQGIRDVRILLNGQRVAVTALTVDRPDVSAVYPELSHGSDTHGWVASVDLPSPGVHILSAEAINIDGISAEIGVRNISVPEASSTTRVEPDADVYNEIRARRWFYDFDLPNGDVTRSYLDERVAPIHTTRLEMMWRALEPVVKGRWSDFTAIDLACHQGYFASHLARRGCHRVVGVDVNGEHVSSARLIARARKLSNLTFELLDVSTVSAEALGSFDITLAFGLLYHVENPVGLLRLARACTRRVCLIETQVGPEMAGTLDWGSRLSQWPIRGAFSVVDETDVCGDAESNLTPISLCPSLDALVWIMEKVGFSRVKKVEPALDAYEQLASGSRVIVAGFVDEPRR